LRWHLNRKTGEVLRVIDRGNQAISNLLSYIWFSIVPVIVDIIIAVVYFTVQFDLYFGLIVLSTMVMYLLLTIVLTEWRTKFRRSTIELENATNSKAVDSLLNFETVKYFANEQFESQSFDSAIRKQQQADRVSQYSLRLLNTTQNILITLGMLGGGLYCFRRIAAGAMDVGDFVLFITYLLQLYQPLNWFGTYFRMVQQNFIDMEKLLDLFKESPEVKDLPMAPDVLVTDGRVVFDNISFTYDPAKAPRPTLDSVSFEIPPGKTVALVGPSGSGKSTCLRLLFRLYDVQSGKITIDGQDIRHCTQRSVRKAIGVVPQDTVLFNDSILYNIRYANIDASEKAVEEAAKQAQIHDKIMQFPEKYQTAVGERGLRLSGGEKQRVAIARTLLKDPKIVLLDEATSALDTQTERAIQSALATITTGRTTLVVAHRLSTIVGADQILVLVDGQIAERGTFTELIELKGRFHEMWQKQLEK
jgi:ATP-binding cassette subfamily B (MDR/TAP) protein 6